MKPPILLKRFLPLAHLAWAVLGLTSFAIFSIGLIAVYQGLQLPCDLRSPADPSFCIYEQQGLEELGLSKAFHAAFTAVGVLIELLPWFIVGLLIYWRRSRDPFAFLFSLLLVLWGVFSFDFAITQWAVASVPALGPVARGLTFLEDVLLLLWLFFPDGRMAHRWVPVVGLLWIPYSFIGNFFPGSPLSFERLTAPWPQVVNILISSILLISAIHRYRKSSSLAQRQQIKWVVVGAAAFAVMFVLTQIIYLFTTPGRSEILTRLIHSPFYYSASAFFAASIAFSILRYRLWEIDVIIRRTLVYGGLTLILALIYFSSVIVLQSLFATQTGHRSPVAIVLSTLAIAALFTPLRRRIQEAIDHRFYRRRYDAAQTLAAFGLLVREEVDLDRLADHLLSVVEETLQPEHLSLWVTPPRPTSQPLAAAGLPQSLLDHPTQDAPGSSTPGV
jgi:hypothetical protein